MAASDSMIQQVLGHGIPAKLSQRLGDNRLLKPAGMVE
jgi:putative membrane protein